MQFPEEITFIAFDIDGTLFSAEEIILPVYEKAIQQFIDNTGKDLAVPSRSEIMSQVGKPVKTIFQNLMPGLEETERDSISNSVLQLLCESIAGGGGHIYEGVKDTVAFLKQQGKKIVVASNGRSPYIEAILQVSGLSSFFEDLVVINNTSIMTKGDILRTYINKYKISAKNILMVGDRSSDEQAALDVGAPFIFCKYGHAPKGEVTRFDREIEQITDLRHIR
ncbi:MAG: HAD family hydrolase [Spirochaetota bacterium]